MYPEYLQRASRPLVILVLCATSLLAQAPATPEKPAPSTQERRSEYVQMATAIGDDYFDGNDTVDRVQRHLQIARAIGARYLRFGFSWNGVEPERRQYRFEFWDMLVREASSAGIELIPYVAYTPKWAASKEENFWEQPPRDPTDYANVMWVLAQRYRGKIRHWELWNEPDNKEYWQGTPDEFATMIIRAASAVRQVAPEDTLILGGMSQGPGSFFDVLISKYHLDQFVDVLALHAYPESWHEERAETAFGPWIEQMHEVAEGTGRKLWLNEMGYADYRYEPNHASLWGTNAYYSYEHTRRYQAEFLFKSFVMTLASGDVALAGWYRIDDFREGDSRMPQDKVHYHLGITDVNGKPKPAYFALRFLDALFSKPAKVLDRTLACGEGCATPGRSQAVVNVFQRRDGRVIVAAWLRSSNYSEVMAHSGTLIDERRERVDVPLPCIFAKVTTYDVLGNKLGTRYQRQRTLRGVPVRGDRVYVADVTCSASRIR